MFRKYFRTTVKKNGFHYLCPMNEDLHHLLDTALDKLEEEQLRDHYLQHPDKVTELFAVVRSDEHNLKKNSGWLLLHIAKKDVTPLLPHADTCLKLPFLLHDDLVLRNVLFVCEQLLKKLSENDLEHHVALIDRCMDFVMNGTYRPGTRCNALSALAPFCRITPELAHEIRLLIETFQEKTSKGMKTRFRHVLASLDTFALQYLRNSKVSQ